MMVVKRFPAFGLALRAAQREFRKGCTWVVAPETPGSFQIFDGKNKVMEIRWPFDLRPKKK